MITFSRTIRKNLLALSFLAINSIIAGRGIFTFTKSIYSPARDCLWVKRKITAIAHRAVRYGTCFVVLGIEIHVAYLTARFDRYNSWFLPIGSPYGTARNFNESNQNVFTC